MKKIVLTIIMVFLVSVVTAYADWAVTVTWTPSAGPGLANERVLLDDIEKCDVAIGNPATCAFTVTTLTNQEVSIVSYNTSGTASLPYVVGSLLVAPTPATGGVILITPIP